MTNSLVPNLSNMKNTLNMNDILMIFISFFSADSVVKGFAMIVLEVGSPLPWEDGIRLLEFVILA